MAVNAVVGGEREGGGEGGGGGMGCRGPLGVAREVRVLWIEHVRMPDGGAGGRGRGGWPRRGTRVVVVRCVLLLAETAVGRSTK